jgi:hypothetical protein
LVIDGLVIGTSGKLFQLVLYNNLEIPIFYFLFRLSQSNVCGSLIFAICIKKGLNELLLFYYGV